MAGDALIAAYAADLSRRLGGRTPAVAAEVRDHLSESVAGRIAAGAAPDDAVHEAIAAFGDPEEVARSFQDQGVLLPDPTSGRAGRWLLLAATLFAAAVVAFTAAQVVEWRRGWYSTPQTLGSIGCLCLASSLGAWAMGMPGLARRIGAPTGATIAACVLLVVGAVIALPAWFLWGWTTALALGVGWILPRMRRIRLGPRWAAWAVTLGGAGAMTSAWLPLGLGWPGSHVLSSGTVRLGVAVGMSVMAAGVGRVGSWMIREAAPTAIP